MCVARLEARLHITQVSAWELRVVLAGHFGRVRGLDENTLSYLRGSEVALLTRYVEDRVMSVTAGPALTEDDVGALQAAIELGVMADAGRGVRRQIAFASVPVQGSWRFRDVFQILPAPDDAPRPLGPMGHNPFVLEVSFADSPHTLLATERGATALREANLLLSAFVPRIEGPAKHGHIGFHWAIVIGQPVTRSVWTQKMYTFEGFDLVANVFATPSHTELPLLDERALYSERGLMGDETLELPASIESIFEHYYALDSARRARLFRWAHWICHAPLVAGLSLSASYMALIQAVEALRPEQGSGPACVKCGRPTGPGPTRQFIEFMEQYVPAEDDDTERARRELYRLRSGLTHGGKLLSEDLHPGFGQFTLTWADERRALDRAATLARLAGINWLLAEGK